ncbi:MAG TPA: hypothetical protein VFP35_03480 [Candidatus Saccharimonadales bacterium]|nr:hypothetical protein [Candidatus Saccharimonadales bacterium]
MARGNNSKPAEGPADKDFEANFKAEHDRDRFREDKQAFRDYVAGVVAKYAAGQSVWMVRLAGEPTSYTLFSRYRTVGRLETTDGSVSDLYIGARQDGQTPVGRVPLGVGVRALSAFAEVEQIAESMETE